MVCCNIYPDQYFLLDADNVWTNTESKGSLKQTLLSFSILNLKLIYFLFCNNNILTELNYMIF